MRKCLEVIINSRTSLSTINIYGYKLLRADNIDKGSLFNVTIDDDSLAKRPESTLRPLGADGEVREVDFVHGVVGPIPLLVETRPV